MLNSKLIQIFKTFSNIEFKEFGKYVSSPYFNNRSELIRFYDALRSAYPEFSESKIMKEEIFKKIYRVKYKDVLMRKLISNMLGLAENFLSVQVYKNNKFETSRNLLSELSKRKLTKLFDQRMRESEKELAGSVLNSVYYYNKSSLLHLTNEHAQTTEQKVSYLLKQSEADLVDKFIISRSLELYLQLINFEKTRNRKYEKKLYEELALFAGKNLENYELPAKINYYLIMLITRGAEEDYYNLKKLKDENKNEIDIHQLFNIYINLTNYCLDMVYAGFPEYRKERFELDKEFVATDLFSEKGYFPISYFTTVVENAAFYKEFAWGENFMDKFLETLEPEYIIFAEAYSKALLSFARGEYSKILSSLAKIYINDARWKMQINILTLKAYYETGNYEAALLLVDSCKHSLKNPGEIPEDRKMFYLHFVNYTGKLVEAKEKNSSLQLDDLNRKIIKSGYFREKEWLIEKIKDALKYAD